LKLNRGRIWVPESTISYLRGTSVGLSIEHYHGANMPRHRQYTSAQQIPLELDPLTNPTQESILRAAFERLKISRRLTLEQAMRDTAYAIGIRNLAEAMMRRTKDQRRQPSRQITLD
jgi:hypothetical protein